MSDLKAPWSVHADHQTSAGRFDVFSSEGYLVAVATTRERAELICSVPELLETLKSARLVIEKLTTHGSTRTSCLQKIDAAIAKELGQ